MFWIEALMWFLLPIAVAMLAYDVWEFVRFKMTKKALMGINEGTNGQQHARITRFAFWANKKGISQLFFLE